MNYTLIDRALEKASKAEREGNLEERDKWMEFAERAEKVYKKLEEIKHEKQD